MEDGGIQGVLLQLLAEGDPLGRLGIPGQGGHLAAKGSKVVFNHAPEPVEVVGGGDFRPAHLDQHLVPGQTGDGQVGIGDLGQVHRHGGGIGGAARPGAGAGGDGVLLTAAAQGGQSHDKGQRQGPKMLDTLHNVLPFLLKKS